MDFYYSELIRRKDLSILTDSGRFSYGNIKYPPLYELEEMALKMCPVDKKPIVRDSINSIWNGIYQDIRNGDFCLLNPHYGWFNVLDKLHPRMKEVADEFKAINKKLDEMGIHYGYPLSRGSGKVSFWPRCLARQNGDYIGSGMIYYECVWGYQESWASYGDKEKFKLTFPARDKKEFYEKARHIAANNLYEMTQCPFCKKGRIRTRLFKRQCDNCHKIIPTSF